MKSAALLLACLAGGVAIGWISVDRRGPAEDQKRESTAPTRRQPRPAPETASGPVWDESDFRRAAEEYAAAVQNPDQHDKRNKLLADYSDEELIAALDESLKDPRLLHDGGMHSIVPPLFSELLRRDFDKGLEWFSEQSGVHQAALAAWLSLGWPTERIEEAIQFVINNKDLFRRSVPWSILQRGVSSAAQRGADAVAGLIERLSANQVPMNFRTKMEFPPGFDFAGLAASPAFKALSAEEFKAGFLNAWRLADRDSAWEWTLEEEGPRALSTFYDFEAGKKDNRLWLGGKLDTLPSVQRSELLDWISIHLIVLPDLAVPLIEGAQDPLVKGEIQNRVAQGIFIGKAHDSIKVLDSLTDNEARIRFMDELQPSELTRSRQSFSPLDEKSENLLRAKFKDWGADESRAETIINRLKNP